ncbi:hypothetical protein HDE_01265 [Halotydeus destructor]|nr:hypothetical protein HDE_01265 [Halotydeus destructor]
MSTAPVNEERKGHSKPRQMKRALSSPVHQQIRRTKGGRIMGYYLLLDFQTFVAHTGLPPASHPPIIPVKLEQRWVWSPYSPYQMICSFKPKNVRHIVPVLQSAQAQSSQEKHTSEGSRMRFDSGSSQGHSANDSTKTDSGMSQLLEDIQEEEDVHPEAICITPPLFVFGYIPINESMLQKVDILRADIVDIIECESPLTEFDPLPFNPYQRFAGVTEEAKGLGILQ